MRLFIRRSALNTQKSVLKKAPFKYAESRPVKKRPDQAPVSDIEVLAPDLNLADILQTATDALCDDIIIDHENGPECGRDTQVRNGGEVEQLICPKAPGQIETAANIDGPQITASRRKLFKDMACLGGLQLVAGLTSAHRDYELLRLCAEFYQLERTSRDLWEYENPSFWAVLFQKQQVLADKICALQPKTLEGFKALARAITGWSPGMSDQDFEDINGSDAQLLGFLMRHLVETTG